MYLFISNNSYKNCQKSILDWSAFVWLLKFYISYNESPHRLSPFSIPYGQIYIASIWAISIWSMPPSPARSVKTVRRLSGVISRYRAKFPDSLSVTKKVKFRLVFQSSAIQYLKGVSLAAHCLFQVEFRHAYNIDFRARLLYGGVIQNLNQQWFTDCRIDVIIRTVYQFWDRF